jgi:hypothetical protein
MLDGIDHPVGLIYNLLGSRVSARICFSNMNKLLANSLHPNINAVVVIETGVLMQSFVEMFQQLNTHTSREYDVKFAHTVERARALLASARYDHTPRE